MLAAHGGLRFRYWRVCPSVSEVDRMTSGLSGAYFCLWFHTCSEAVPFILNPKGVVTAAGLSSPVQHAPMRVFLFTEQCCFSFSPPCINPSSTVSAGSHAATHSQPTISKQVNQQSTGIWLYIFNLRLFIVCMDKLQHHVGVTGHLAGVTSLFPYVGSMDQTHVLRPGSRCLYSWATSPHSIFVFIFLFYFFSIFFFYICF